MKSTSAWRIEANAMLVGGVCSRAVASHPISVVHLSDRHFHPAVTAGALCHQVRAAIPLLHSLRGSDQLTAQHWQQGRCAAGVVSSLGMPPAQHRILISRAE